MFCHKCGNQLPEDSGFCHKCGTKVIIADTIRKTSDTPIQSAEVITACNDEVSPAASAVPVQTTIQERKFVPAVAQPIVANTGFKEFVDGRIRETTEFQSAEDLLNNSKPMTPLWICFGVVMLFFTILGFVQGMPAGILLGIFFGYPAAFIAGGVLRSRFRSKFFKVIDGRIDTDDLIQFLSNNLSYLRPHFNEWGYMKQGGFIIGTIGKMASEALNEVIICTTFSVKQKQLTNICIRPDPTNPNSGQTQIIFGAENNGIIFFNLDTRFPMHICLFKTIPITSAAVEYYLKSKGLKSV